MTDADIGTEIGIKIQIKALFSKSRLFLNNRVLKGKHISRTMFVAAALRSLLVSAVGEKKLLSYRKALPEVFGDVLYYGTK